MLAQRVLQHHENPGQLALVGGVAFLVEPCDISQKRGAEVSPLRKPAQAIPGEFLQPPMLAHPPPERQPEAVLSRAQLYIRQKALHGSLVVKP